jgi:hypothetical protein
MACFGGVTGDIATDDCFHGDDGAFLNEHASSLEDGGGGLDFIWHCGDCIGDEVIWTDFLQQVEPEL